MIESWTFMAALFFGSLLFGFHGLVLLIAPDKYPPAVQWGRPAKLELLQKQPLDLGKRLAGLCLAAFIGWFFTRPAVLWMYRPKPITIYGGSSPLPPGMPRWDLLLMGLFSVGCGLFLVARPERLARALFRAGRSCLQDKPTLILWTIYSQLFGVLCLLMSALIFRDFAASL